MTGSPRNLLIASTTDDLYQIADELRSIASWGLQCAENQYDTERYQRVLAVSARLLATIQTGTQEEVLAKAVSSGGAGNGEAILLADIAAAMTDASICGLGQTASSAVQSALKLGLVVGPK